MDANFEDFLDLAADRLDRAALTISDGAKVSAATCAALSSATRSLIILGGRYGQTPHGTPVATWQPAFVDRLRAADRRLRHHADFAKAPTTADALISDAARLLTVGQDLLATHLRSPDPPRQVARTPQGEELLGAPVREHVLRRAAELARHLADLTHTVRVFYDLPREQPHLVHAYRPRERELTAAARELADAAAQSLGPATARLHLPPAPVLAASVTYPAPHERPAHAAEQARDALHRMATAAYRAAHPPVGGEYPPAHAAGDLKACAAHLAAAHALAADLLTRLAPHLPMAGWNAAEAVDRLRAAGADWARLRRAWAQIVSVPDSGPRSPLILQATGITIRLGRLLYADPAWTPDTGPGRPRVLGDLLVPDILDALCATISSLPRDAATIAANHARLVTNHVLDLHSTDRVHRPDGEGRRAFPLQPAQRGKLATGYHQVTSAASTAATGLVPLSRGYQALKTMALTTTHAVPRMPTGPSADQTSHRVYRQPPIAPKR